MFGLKKKVSEVDFVATGCVDCGFVTARPKSEPKVGSPNFEYGASAVRVWRESDNKHHLIVVSTKPERVFLSCQHPDKLLTADGVAAILNFVANIPENSEVKV